MKKLSLLLVKWVMVNQVLLKCLLIKLLKSLAVTVSTVVHCNVAIMKYQMMQKKKLNILPDEKIYLLDTPGVNSYAKNYLIL
jgi:hypothetical protein